MAGWTHRGHTWTYTDADGDTLNVMVGHMGNVLMDASGRNGCQVSAADLTTLIELLTQARDKAASDDMEARARVLATEIRHAYGAYVTGEQIDEWLGHRDRELRDRVRTLIATARVEITWDEEDGS